MALITVTNTFINGTTADAAQVNTNFTDILNGLSDGTKSIVISGITAGGTIQFDGAVTLGVGSGVDVSILGSIAATIPVKTNAAFDFGSATKGMAGYYIGGTSTFTTRLASLATASYTFSYPAIAGSANQVLENIGSSSTIWAVRDSSEFACNYSLSCSVNASTHTLTIALKDSGGSDASAASPIKIAFRDSTLTTGTYPVRSVTSALSMIVSSGSTLGHVSAVPDYIYVYAIDNAGTVELAISSIRLDEGGVYTSVAEGASGAADSRTVLYSTTARTSKAIRLLGRLLSTKTTAGTWDVVPTETFSSSRTVEPAADDIHATKIGSKTYYHGTTYNGAVAPTVSGTSWTTTRAWFQPFQDQAGTWFVKYGISGNRSGTVNGFTVSINGLVSKNTSVYKQPVFFSADVGAGGAFIVIAIFAVNSGDISVALSGSLALGAFNVSMGGIVECESKPTWAY